MKNQFLLLIFFFAVNTKFSYAQSGSDSAQNENLIGIIHKEDFQKGQFKEWFNLEYSSYKLDTLSLRRIKDTFENKSILIYFASWCSDSRREVPRFIKICDYLKADYNKVSFTGLDRKKQAPNYKLNKWNIVYVPTFIVLSKGNEIGRIIESPKKSLEIDLIEILKQ